MDEKRLKLWKNGRLYYYQDHADAKYWDNYWGKILTKEYYKRYKNGKLDEYSGYFQRYLKKSDYIIEAGCGAARYIVALRAKGYENIEGIDWSESTIERVRSLNPNLPVKVGNVTRIKVPENTYDGYISVGVAEHRKEGPETFLTEAFRILKPGGYAYISVPYVNPLRRLKGQLGFYKLKNQSKTNFYQYAFKRTEFSKYLLQAGFKIIETHGVAGYFGLKEELPGFFNLIDNIKGGRRIRKYIKYAEWVNIFGHMMLFICRKPIK